MEVLHGIVKKKEVFRYITKNSASKSVVRQQLTVVVLQLFLLVQQNAHNKQEKVTQAPTFLTVLESKHVGSISFLPTKVIKVCCQIFVFHVFWY